MEPEDVEWDPDTEAAFIRVATYLDGHGREILGESIWYVFEELGGER